MKRTRFLFALGVAVCGGTPIAARAIGSQKNRIVGVVVSISGNTLIVQRRNGKQITVDVTEAATRGRLAPLEPHMVAEFHGTYQPDGSFHCVSTSHSSDVLSDWQADI